MKALIRKEQRFFLPWTRTAQLVFDTGDAGLRRRLLDADDEREFVRLKSSLVAREVGRTLGLPASYIEKDILRQAEQLASQHLKRRLSGARAIELELAGFDYDEVYAQIVFECLVLLPAFKDAFFREFATYAKRYGMEPCAEKGLPAAVFAHASEIAANGEHDVGVGIGRDGLVYSFIFSLCGMETLNIFLRRRKGGYSYRPLDRLEGIGGKRVLLIENDQLTGGSLEKVCNELKRYSPASLSVYFGSPSKFEVVLPPEVSRAYLRSEFERDGCFAEFKREFAVKFLRERDLIAADFSFAKVPLLIDECAVHD